MCTVAKEAADAVRSLMDARELHFTTEIEDGPLWVAGDPEGLRQLQVDLLNNAAKYTSRDGHVRLLVGREDGHVIVRVVDDGVGIADGMLENMFDFFVQSRRSADRPEGGLARVRSLVSMHGGEITAKSEGAGKGAELTVRLPLVAPSESAMRPPEHARAPSVRQIPENAKIVVVEDSIDSCLMLCELLSLANFTSEAAHDGRTGLELIARTHPDVAIIDVGLPEMDGFEVARRLRADPNTSDVFLIALTGYGQPSDRERALESGFDEHVVKPVHPDKLLRLLGREGLRGGAVESAHGGT